MEYFAAVLPSICIGVIFWLIMRSIFRGDRTERTIESASQDDAARWYEDLKQREGDALSFRPPSVADNEPTR